MHPKPPSHYDAGCSGHCRTSGERVESKDNHTCETMAALGGATKKTNHLQSPDCRAMRAVSLLLYKAFETSEKGDGVTPSRSLVLRE